jgi:histidyl-tRNA synthetase
MLDVLPPDSGRWIDVISRFAVRAERFGYGLIVTPVVEHYEVFERVGEQTDVVSKEMYAFEDRGGRRLALRPEGTASVVRAYVQHRPVTPWKVWYVAPNFRAEAPQAGRYRQHWQLGAEALGVDDPGVDVEMISLLYGFYADLGLQDVALSLNSLGDAETRERYRGVLLDYWRGHASVLGKELERAEANPMRILDSKREDWADVIEKAPQIVEYLSADSAAHFDAVQAGLRAIGIPFEISPRLVRGLDYYTNTVFEFASGALAGAQNAIGGGGRYDGLAEQMEGPSTPGIGFGSGIERLLIACDAEGVLPVPGSALDAFVVDTVGGTEATLLLEELRTQGLAADRAYGGRSMKKQWAAADKSGARFGVLLAPRELEAGVVAVKDLATGTQTDVHRDEVAAWIRTKKDEQTQ